MSGRIVIGEGVYELRTDDSQFRQGLRQADKDAQGLGARLGKVGKAGAVALGGIGIAASGAAALSVQSFRGFEKQMNEVFTLLPGISQSAMKDLTGQVKTFSKEFGVLPNETVPALYQALSAGVPRDNVFTFLETAQKAAVGGITDLTTTVDAVSTVTNAWGADVISATEASDLMFTAVRLGKTTFDEIGGSISNVAPIAASLGVQFGDVTAAIAALTAQGVPTSVATTQIRGALAELGKEGTEVSDVFKEVTGTSFQNFIAEGGNLQTALQALEEHAEANNLSMVDLFGSIEAGQAALALTGKGTEAFTDALAAMDESAGATQSAYDQMQSGLDQSIKKIRAHFEVLKLEVGSRLAPAFAALLGLVIDRVIPGIQELADRVSGPVSHAFGLIRDAVITAGQALRGDWTNAEGIHPLHQIVGRVVTLFRDTLFPVVRIVADLFQGDFSGALEGTIAHLKDFPRRIKEAASILLSIIPVGEIFSSVLDAIQDIDWRKVAGEVGGALASGFSTLGNLGTSLLGSLADTLASADWGGIASTIAGGILGGLGAIADFGSRFLGFISDKISAVDWTGLASTIGNGILTGLTAIADFGTRFLGWISNQVTAVDWTALATTIGNGILTGLSAIVDFGSRFLSWMQTTITSVDWSGIANSITSGISTALTAAAGAGGEAGSFIQTWLSSQIAGTQFEPIASGIQSGIQSALSALPQPEGGAGGLLGNLLGDISGLATTVQETVVPALSSLADLLGPRILPTIETFRTSIGQIISQLGPQLTPILDSLRQSWANLQPAIAPVATVLATVAGIVAGVLFVALNTLANVIGSMLPGVFQGIIGIIQTFAGVLELVTNAASSMVQIVVGLLTGDWQMAWDGAKQLVTGTVDAIISIVGGLWTAISGILDALVSGVIGFFEGLWHSLVGGSIVPDMITDIITWFGKLPGEVVGIVSGFIGSVLGYFSDLLATVPGLVSDLIGSVQGYFSDLAATVPGVVSGLVTTVLGSFTNLLEGGVAKVGQMVTGILTKAGELVSQFAAKINEMIDAALAVLGTLPGRAVSALGDIGSALYQAGRDLIQGFIDGIGSLAGSAVEAAKGVGQGAIDTITSFGRSPWPAMIAAGRDAIDGLLIGFEDKAPEVFERVNLIADTIQNVFESMATAMEIGSQLEVGFTAPDAGITGGIISFATSLIEQIQTASSHLESEGLEAATSFSDAAGKIVDFIGNAADSLRSLIDLQVDFGSIEAAVSTIKFLVEHAVRSIGDTAAVMAVEFVLGAQTFADSALSVVELIGSAAESLRNLIDFTVDLEAAKDAISQIKFLIEHAVTSIGDTAALVASQRPDGFLGAAQLFADAAGTVMDALERGLQFLSGLAGFDGQFNLAGAMDFASKLKFLIEHVVVSIGDSARYLASIRPEDFLAPIQAFADATGAGFQILNDALSFMKSVIELDENQFTLAGIGEWTGMLVRVAELVARDAGAAVTTWSTEANPQLSAFRDDVLASLAVVSETLRTLREMANLPDLQAINAGEIAATLLNIARIVGEAAQQASSGWAEQADPHLQAFSDDVRASMEAMGAVGQFLLAMSEFKEDPKKKAPPIRDRIDEMLGTVEYVIDGLAEISEDYSTEGLEHLGTFADSTRASLDMVTSAGQAFEAIAGVSEISADNMTTFRDNFRAVLDLVRELNRLGQEYLQDAISFQELMEQIAAAMEAAAAAIDTAAGSVGNAASGSGSGANARPGSGSSGSTVPVGGAGSSGGATGGATSANPGSVVGVGPRSGDLLFGGFDLGSRRFGGPNATFNRRTGQWIINGRTYDPGDLPAGVLTFLSRDLPRLDRGGLMLQDAPIFAHRGEIVAPPAMIEDAIAGGRGDIHFVTTIETRDDPHAIADEFEWTARRISRDPAWTGV